MSIYIERLGKVLNQELTAFGRWNAEESGSGREEVILYFKNGDKVIIYVDDNGGLSLEVK